MGWFSRPKKRTVARMRSASRTVVRVAYVNSIADVHPGNLSDRNAGYAYVWGIPGDPVVGDRIVVPANDDLEHAVVIGFGRGDSARGMTLKHVLRRR